MPIQFATCPECFQSIAVDVPIGQRAELEHTQDGVDVVRLKPRVRPIERPQAPGQPKNPLEPLDTSQADEE